MWLSAKKQIASVLVAYYHKTERENKVVLLVGFFKDAERDQQQEGAKPKITYFFKKGGKNWKCLLQAKGTVLGGLWQNFNEKHASILKSNK